MKLMVLAAVMGSIVMDEAESGSSSGGIAGIEAQVIDGDPAPTLAGIERAISADDQALHEAFKLRVRDAAVDMRVGGEYHGREDYVVTQMAAFYRLPEDEVRSALRAALGQVEAELAAMEKEAAAGDKPHVPPSPQLDRNTAAAAGGGETPDPVDTGAKPGVDGSDEYALACAEGTPKVALVGKYQDQVPVQLRDKHHLAKLVAEHGEGNVVVQS